MEDGDSIFDSIFDENVKSVDDVEMLDVEGDLVEQNVQTDVGQSSWGDVTKEHHDCGNEHRKRRNKKKNKRKKGNSGSNITDISRFVVAVCRRLKERKSYLVWTAIGSLGISAFDDLVKEVEAIQACGGQKTSDGRRFCTGGGVLWNILKLRDPNVYKEIMKKGNEFEKQFKPQTQNKATSSQGISFASTNQTTDGSAGVSEHIDDVQNQPEQQSFVEQKVSSVHNRIWVPVAYDDLLGLEYSKDESTLG